MDEAVPGWFLAGSHPEQYESRVTDELEHDARVACVRFVGPGEPQGFGTLMQAIDASAFRGSHVRLSGRIRAQGVGWAALWMRVDEPDGRTSAFDNQSDRPVVGDADWTVQEIVLDVGPLSAAVSFGVLIDGAGEIAVTALRFEAVDSAVPTTDTRPQLPPAPQNLDFSAPPIPGT